MFRGAPGSRRMTERSFGGSRQVLRASWAISGETQQPTQGLCAPPRLLHLRLRGWPPLGQPHPLGLGGKAPGGETLALAAAPPLAGPICLGRRPLGGTLGAPPPLSPPYIKRGRGRAATQVRASALPSLSHEYLRLFRSAWRSPAGIPPPPSPPRRRAAGFLRQLLLPPCWIKKEETSPSCTCVERGGTVRSVLGSSAI